MNLLAWLLSLSLMVFVLAEAVNFHKATVCRQRAWLKSTELYTRSLLDKPKETELAVDLGCRIYLNRKQRTVSWRRLPQLKKHQFRLNVFGKV